MAKVIAIIAARLNSSRLPGKQLLDLAGEPLIARIFQRLEKVSEIDEIVLATTADDYNQALIAWAQQAGKNVFAYDGDINDVVGRVDAVVQSYGADFVVFCCGDSPLIEPTTLSRMIIALQQHQDAEHVVLHSGIEGETVIHEGFYPYRRELWNRINEMSNTPELREHIGLVISQFAAELSTCSVDELAVFSEVKHRISVDTISDYHFMSELYRRWYEENDGQSIVSLPWVINQLKNDTGLVATNRDVRQRKPSDLPPRVLMVAQCGEQVGLGHLSRSCVVARQFQDQLAAGVTLLLQGDEADYTPLKLFHHRTIDWHTSLVDTILYMLEQERADIVLFDLAKIDDLSQFQELLSRLGEQKRVRVVIDNLFDCIDKVDLVFVPSFYLAPELLDSIGSHKVSYGWDHYLLQPPCDIVTWQPGSRLLVMTGGSDLNDLGNTWPILLDRQLPDGIEITWIKGPYAEPPVIPVAPRLAWQVLENPADLSQIMSQSHYALCLYGISFFELLLRGVPTVVWSSNPAQKTEMYALIKYQVASMAETMESAVEDLNKLIRDESLSRAYHNRAITTMGGRNGPALLVEQAWQMVEQVR